jgi:hypothetical protein
MCRNGACGTGAWPSDHALFTDYLGTVAADDAEAVMDRPSLYELAQIDRDRYTILGIELNVDGPTTATVYAFD